MCVFERVCISVNICSVSLVFSVKLLLINRCYWSIVRPACTNLAFVPISSFFEMLPL